MRKTCSALLLLAGLAWPAEKMMPLRWVYISRSLTSDQQVEDIRKIAKLASENGLNGVLFAAGLDSIDLKPPEYMARLQKVKAIFNEYHLEMIPNVFSAGYGGGILSHDKNLAEGLPVKDALYVVKGDEARLQPEVPLADGGPAVEGVWTREVEVKPYRCYRISFRVKSEGLPATRPFTSGPFRLTVQTDDGTQPDAVDFARSPQHRLARNALGLQQHVVRAGQDLRRRAEARNREGLGGRHQSGGGGSAERAAPSGNPHYGAGRQRLHGL